VEDIMKRLFLAAAAAAASAVAGAAIAADLPRGPSPYYAPAASYYNWGGWYAGLNLGYQWGNITNNPTSPSGVLGGAQVGFNWQSGGIVLGGETDIQLSGANDTFAPWKFSNPWFGTLRARLGYAMNNILFYGTGGFAYGGLTGQLGRLEESKTHAGWTIGAGMEVGFTPKWSAKVEYLYMDLGDRGYTITGVNNGFESNILRFGVNYHF
jgi:outer membrane immunogenic protein